MRSLLLNGEWELTYHTLGKPEDAWDRWIPAQVPGDIHLDLLRAGLIAEPLVGINTTRYRWIEAKEWWYRRQVNIPADFLDSRVEWVCDGLDLAADLFVNGVHVGAAANMFIQHRFDVTAWLKSGINEFSVRLDVGYGAADGKPIEKFAKSWGRNDLRRPWMRKAQQAFYWDVAPRLLTCGIWRDTWLESYAGAALHDVHVTSQLAGESATINVQLEVEGFSEQTCVAHVDICNASDQLVGRVEQQLVLTQGRNTAELNVVVAEPQLWYPNGLGEPYLYALIIRVTSIDGAILYGQQRLKHGIRTIVVVQEPLNEHEKTFTVMVNGHKVFCKGGNWVPSDAIYARINETHERQLLQYAHDANFNMIRVWGGGVYPDEWFYAACDELGIMVWQDFMYACAYYPDDEPEFCAGAQVEAEAVVRKFRNHAALALWCGNNETYWMHNRVNPDGTFYGLKIYGEILPEVCGRLDPGRYYHPSSPYPGQRDEQWLQGDQHVWSYFLGWYELQVQPELWDYPEAEKQDVMRIWDAAEHNHKFVSEYGLWAPSNRASLQRYMGEYPAAMQGEAYQHHRNHFEADFIVEALRRYYKPRTCYAPDEFILAGQALQAEVIKHLVEEFRSRMYVCSGTLFWEYNDCWGHVGYSPVDYYLNVRPLYFYLRRAYAPLHVVFKAGGSEVWLLNETRQRQEVQVICGCLGFNGEHHFLRDRRVVVDPGSTLLVEQLGPALDVTIDRRQSLVYAELYDADGRLLVRNRAFLCPLQELMLPADTMQAQVAWLGGNRWSVEVSAASFTWMVKIDADVNLTGSDNAFDLFPGESRQIEVTTEQPGPGVELRVDNLNRWREA